MQSAQSVAASHAVPTRIDVEVFSSIPEMFERSVAAFRERVAYVNMGRSLTYADLGAKVRDFAAFLQGHLGLAKGTRVALMMPNLLQYPVALFGTLRAGCIVVNCNPLYSPRELEHQLADSGAEVVVVLENFAHVVADVVGRTGVKTVVVTRVGDLLGGVKGALANFMVKRVKKMVRPWHIPGHVPFTRALADGARHAPEMPELARDDLAFLQYTGGTTGSPKGAMLTHGNVMANMLQGYAWLEPVLRDTRETILTALPLYHIFALTANCLTFLKIGATNVLVTNPRDISGLVKTLRKYRFTTLTGVNTLFNALLHHPKFSKIDFSSLRISLGGGMAVQSAVAAKWKAVTGRPLIEAYGMTEASPCVTMNPLDAREFNGSIGLPFPNTEVVIRDEEGRDVPMGEPGELCVRGPQVMRGYWNNPEETRAAMTHDGFLKTGDIARVDAAGYYYIVDRKKDMINVSGFNVFPTEIEEVLADHPGILEAGAISVPDEHSGEKVKVVVVRKDPELDAESVVEHCRRNLAAYKVPRIVEFRTELPKTNIGKILRRALR
jgi:long-chain acyl-CoA synthetase